MGKKVTSPPAKVKRFFDPLTIGSLLVGGKLISDQIKGIIDKVSAEVRAILRDLDSMINELIETIEEKYQDNL